jgi:iron complex transport system permease protein
MALDINQVTPAFKASPAYLHRRRSRLWAILGLVLVLLMLTVIALILGSVRISLITILKVLVNHLPLVNIQPDWSSSTEMILMSIRLPRIFMAGLVGAALAIAGATYQGLFRNPLADPYLIGVSQGSALGAVIGFVLPWSITGLSIIPVFAFIGAIAAVGIVYAIARVGKTLPVTTLILAGVAIGAFLSAITSYLILISGDKLHGIISWLLGQLALSDWSQVRTIAPYIVIGAVIIFLYSRPLNVMQLDEEQAQQLGVNVEQVKLILLAAATLITAAAVCYVGMIGFVGIIIPHAVRLVWGSDYRYLLPLSALAGAALLILADTAGRTLLSPSEIPVGIITAFLGAPFFLILLRRKKKAVF